MATLSNQNLMGRLVYVREVRIPVRLFAMGHDIEARIRTVRPSLVSAHLGAAAALPEACRAATEVAATAPAAACRLA